MRFIENNKMAGIPNVPEETVADVSRKYATSFRRHFTLVLPAILI
jgi:hypothetical protein